MNYTYTSLMMNKVLFKCEEALNDDTMTIILIHPYMRQLSMVPEIVGNKTGLLWSGEKIFPCEVAKMGGGGGGRECFLVFPNS